MSAKDRAMAFRDEIQPCGTATVFSVGDKTYCAAAWVGEPSHRKYFTRMADAVVFYKPSGWYIDSAQGLVFIFEEELS